MRLQLARQVKPTLRRQRQPVVAQGTSSSRDSPPVQAPWAGSGYGRPPERPKPGRRRGGNALFVHIVLYVLALGVLLFLNLVSSPFEFWAHWPAWGWGMILATHTGAVISPRRWLGAHIGFFLVANLGLFGIWIAETPDQQPWFIWPLLVWGAILILHAGISIVRSPPAMLTDDEDPVSQNVVSDPVRSHPYASLSTQRAGRSPGVSIISIGLGVFAVAVAVVAVAGGVGEAFQLRGSGNPASRYEVLESFDRVEVSGTGSATIRTGDTYGVTITGDDNLIDDVSVTVNNSRLRIAFGANPTVRLQLDQPMRYEITVPSLVQIRADGGADVFVPELLEAGQGLSIVASNSATINIVELRADRLAMSLSNNARVEIAGVVAVQVIGIADDAIYRGFDVISREVTVEAFGSASVDLWADTSLTGVVRDSALVRYQGEAKPHITILDDAAVRAGDSLSRDGNRTVRR